MVSPRGGAEIINDSKFEDFKLHVEFSCQPQLQQWSLIARRL
jgi:hypothetical protein